MSEEKIARCVIEELKLDPIKNTLSLKAKLTGTIKSGHSWEIKPASTTVKCVEIPAEEFVGRVMSGWFWVRKVQDVLRKGSKKDAEQALTSGYDWADSVTRKPAAPATTEELAAKIIQKQPTLSELNSAIAKLLAEAARLEGME
jgi:hypothetical protein